MALAVVSLCMRTVFGFRLVKPIIVYQPLVAAHRLLEVVLKLAVQLGCVEAIFLHILGSQREVGPSAKQLVLQVLQLVLPTLEVRCQIPLGQFRGRLVGQQLDALAMQVISDVKYWFGFWHATNAVDELVAEGVLLLWPVEKKGVRLEIKDLLVLAFLPVVEVDGATLPEVLVGHMSISEFVFAEFKTLFELFPDFWVFSRIVCSLDCCGCGFCFLAHFLN